MLRVGSPIKNNYTLWHRYVNDAINAETEDDTIPFSILINPHPVSL